MNPTPHVSVIIPTFNRASFLREAMDSVLAQTERDLELIIVDDGSQDHTPGLCKGLDQRIRYFYQPNRGVSAARNLGIQKSRGELIAFLDSDDLWMPDKLARQVEWMSNHEAIPLCHTDEIWIRRGRRVNPKKIHRKSGGWIYPLCLPRCMISPSSVLIRRRLFEIVGGFDESLPICEDYDLWLRITSRFEVGYLAEPLIIKRGGHSDQLSQSQWGIDRYRVTALCKMLASDCLSDEWREQTVAMLEYKCAILANGYRKRGKFKEAGYYNSLIEEYHRQSPSASTRSDEINAVAQ